jgi:hypothetical protein
LRSDSTTRTAVRQAQIVLFGSTAGANLNEADARLEAKQCKGEACYSSALRAWGRDYRQIVAAAAALRGAKNTVLCGVTEPNIVPGAQDMVATVQLGLYQARLIKQTVCAAMTARGGRCIDVLTALNGRSGRRTPIRVA